MTKVQVFEVENRLAAVVREPGGKTIEQAVRAAETRVESLRDRCLSALDAKADELAAAAATAQQSGDGFDDVYRVSNAIYGVAGAFDLRGLAEAASSLCDLVEGFRSGKPVNWPAITVHVDGIRLLTGEGEAGAEAVLEGLRQVRARFAPAETGGPGA